MCPGSTFSAFKRCSGAQFLHHVVGHDPRNYAGRPPISLRWQIESVADARALATGSEQFRHTAYLTSNIRIARSPLPQANQACRGRGLKKGIGGPLTIERLVDAITGGTLAVALHDRLALLEDRRLQLEGSAVNRGHPRAAPPPNLADVYRQRVAELTRVLEADNAAEAPELVRSLVETITLVPEGGVLRIEVRGELAAILRIAEGAERARNAGRDADALAVQIKMVAGTGFEPVTFRL